LVIAIAMPISTKTTMAICIQIQEDGIRTQRRRARVGALVVSLASVLALCLSTPLAQARPALMRGITISYDGSEAQTDQQISEAKALHAQVVRVELAWSALEPEAPGRLAPGPLAALDNAVNTAAADGLKVIALVQSTPCWASSAPTPVERACLPASQSEANAWPPTHPSAYGAFLAYLAQRYGGKLAAIEVWNEPDYSGEQFLAGPNKAGRYAAILKAAYPAVKRVDPGLSVLGGALVGPNGAFLRALYADGIKGYYDGFAVHFYTVTIAALRAIHEVQLQNGDHTPLWLDEFGWSTCWPQRAVQHEQGCVTESVQGTNLVDMIRQLARTPYVAAAVLYKLLDSPGEEFGVLREDGARKLSFGAIAGAFAAPFGNPSPVTLRLRRSGGRVIASGSGPVGDYIELEALEHGSMRYRTIFIMNRFNGYAITLPASLGSKGLLVRAYQYGQGARSGSAGRI
jgi:Cellulase (glycosyl hydrolase family 5)